MQSSGDLFVLVLIIIVLAVWVFFLLRGKVSVQGKGRLPISVKPITRHEMEDEAVELLHESGYDVLSAKHKVPVNIVWNEVQLESRLFIDYFARREGQLFIVRLARDRMPIEFTGSGIRDKLLLYALLYPQTDGVLYLDLKLGKLHKIQFELDL